MRQGQQGSNRFSPTAPQGRVHYWRVWVLSILLVGPAGLQAQIYKIVDEDGNVTFTDQAPNDGTAPMVLPELSVVDTDYADQAAEEAEATAATEQAKPPEPTPRDLRRMYRDFAITRPAQEETFWGTANTVVVSWSSSTPLLQGMSVRLLINGERVMETQDTMVSLTLDRGEHQAVAELLDSRGRRVVSSAPVTFFVHQGSQNFNRPGGSPGAFRGSGGG